MVGRNGDRGGGAKLHVALLIALVRVCGRGAMTHVGWLAGLVHKCGDEVASCVPMRVADKQAALSRDMHELVDTLQPHRRCDSYEMDGMNERAHTSDEHNRCSECFNVSVSEG